MMRTTKLATFEAPKPKPAPPAQPASPLISDTLMASLNTPKPAAPAPAPAPAPAAPVAPTYTVNATQPMKTVAPPPGPESTQKLPVGAERTQRMMAPPPAEKPMTQEQMERTQKIKPLDTAFNPESTQQMDTVSPQSTQKLDIPNAQSTQRLDVPAQPAQPEAGSKEAETTQRIDDSIWRLQEAKRILQNIPQK
jgi:hypothetical protein